MQTRVTDVAQQRINLQGHDGATNEALAETIRKVAHAASYQYPQYDGYWDGAEWQLGRVERNVTTKLGAAFRRGDIVLFRTERYEGDTHDSLQTYSVRNGINTSLDPAWVEPLTKPSERAEATGRALARKLVG